MQRLTCAEVRTEPTDKSCGPRHNDPVRHPPGPRRIPPPPPWEDRARRGPPLPCNAARPTPLPPLFSSVRDTMGHGELLKQQRVSCRYRLRGKEPAVGFEPTTYRLQVGCATGLRHAGRLGFYASSVGVLRRPARRAAGALNVAMARRRRRAPRRARLMHSGNRRGRASARRARGRSALG